MLQDLGIFGLSKYSPGEVTQRYHTLSLLFHPDKCLGSRKKGKILAWLPERLKSVLSNETLNDSAYKAACTEIFTTFNEAYLRLNNNTPDVNQSPVNNTEIISEHLLNNQDSLANFSQLADEDLIKIMTILVRNDAKNLLNARDINNTTLAHFAALQGRKELLKALIQFGANLSLQTKDGCAPAHLAAINGDADLVELLHNANANLDATDNNKCTPIYYAAKCGHVNFIKALKKYGARVDAFWTKNSGGWNPMHAAAERNHVGVVQLLIEFGIAIDSTNNDWVTPVHIAAQNNCADVIKLFVETDKQKFNKLNENTFHVPGPIHLAAAKGHVDVFKMLKDSQINLNFKNKQGLTVAHIAASNNHASLIPLFADLGVDLTAMNNYTTPAHIAAHNNYVEVIKSLANAGVKLMDEKYKKPVSVARDITYNSNGRIQNIKYTYVDSPVHTAVRQNSKDVFEFMVINGVDVDCINTSSPCFPRPVTFATPSTSYIFKLEGYTALTQSIKAILAFGDGLKEKDKEKAEKVAILGQELNKILETGLKTMNNALDLERFKAVFQSKLHSLDSILTQYHATWKVIVANVLLALTGFGLFYVIGKPIYSKLTTDKFTFFYQKSLPKTIDAANAAITRLREYKTF